MDESKLGQNESQDADGVVEATEERGGFNTAHFIKFVLLFLIFITVGFLILVGRVWYKNNQEQQKVKESAYHVIHDLFNPGGTGQATSKAYEELGTDLPIPGKRPSDGIDPQAASAFSSAQNSGDADKKINERGGFTVLAQIPLGGSLSVATDSQAAQASPSKSPVQCSFSTTASKRPNPPVVLSEVAWMGTAKSSSDEWIELMNRSAADIDISGWQVIDKNEQIKVVIKPSARLTADSPQYLLERTDNNSVPGVFADEIYVGALSNSDEGLRLFDSNCNLIDEVLASPDWPAGNMAERRTMERDRADLSWHTYAGAADPVSGLFGTPRASIK